MKKLLRFAGILAAVGGGLLGQEPDGSDISKAIPIYFGQTVSDIGDRQLSNNRVYKVVLARGQQFNIVANTPTPVPRWRLELLSPTVLALGSLRDADILSRYGNYWTNDTSMALAYQVPAAGTYYVRVLFDSTGVNYSLRVSAQGTPIAVPNPTSAGCLNGRVDSITYSLQLIAAGLPDEVTIGGTRACPSCTVKAPLYPEISNRLESALLSGANVEACYDSGGNIFQMKLLRP
jgi:hypothetical protein